MPAETDVPADRAELFDRAPAPETSGPAPATRQCSRCRGEFPADPTLLFAQPYAWWLCPPCDAALLGPRRLASWTPSPRPPNTRGESKELKES
jgi:hypothetical protein